MLRDLKRGVGGSPLLVFIALIFSLIFIPVSPDPRLARELQLLVIGTSILLVYLANNMRFLGALLLWCVYSLYQHPSQAGLNQLAVILCAMGIFRVAQDVPAKLLITMLKAYAVALSVMVGLQALGLFSGSYVTFNALRPYSGFTGSTADTSSALAILLPLFFKPRDILYWIGIVIVILCMKSSIAAIAVGAGAAYLIYPWFKKQESEWRIAYAMLALLFLSATRSQWYPEIEQAVTDDRWHIWWLSIQQVLTNHPVAGYGLAQYQQVFGGLADGVINGVQQVKWFAHPHNEFILVLYELGLIGLSLLLGFCASAFTRCTDRTLKACFISGIIAAQGHFTWHIVVAAVPLIVLLASSVKQKEGDWHGDSDFRGHQCSTTATSIGGSPGAHRIPPAVQPEVQ